jgi:hypothetical protein
MGTLTLRASRPLRAGLVLGVLAVLVTGCGLFKPATPEIGGGGSGCTLVPSYADTGDCLRYMQIGIQLKDDCGKEAYLGALADSTKDGMGFHAFFDQAVWEAYDGIRPADWNLDYEAQFVSLFNNVKLLPYRMMWLPDTIHPYDYTNPEENRMILHRRYEVYALQESPVDTLLIAVGFADLYFAKISASRWVLYRWEDRVDPRVGARPANEDYRTFGYRRLNAGAGG